METSLQKFAREQIISGLHKCTEPQVHMFKRMYSHKDLEADIETVVANMSEEKLDRALDQVNRTIGNE